MTDDGNAPTMPDTGAPTHGSGAPSSTPKPPDARYVMRGLLGRGGMGEIWLAHDVRIDRDIAIKLMRGGGSSDPDAVARFLREARVQGRLEHPSVVPVHDLGGEADSPFFAMKKLTGTTLADVIAASDAEKWPRRTLLARFVDVCLAVEFAHQRGVIHRDLKPANIMLGDYGEAYVLDWGLARIADDADEHAIRNSDLRGDSGVGQTEVGAMLGTPGYMAPEQMRGDPIDQRTDLYALGCILFEILTGVPAVPRDRMLEVTLSAPCHRPAQRCPASEAPPELDDACARATAADPAARFASARALADEVQRFLDGDRDLERRRALAAAHAKRAQELLAMTGIEARAEAMREAGSAIALDPGNRDGAGVLARLLLEPPQELPPAAGRKIEDERQRAMQPVLRGGFLVYLASLIFLPIAAYLGIVGTPPLIAIGCELFALTVLFGLAFWRGWFVSRTIVVAGAALHMTLLATFGIVFGPLLVAPILIFGSLPIMLTMPILRLPKTVFAFHAGAVFVPMVLELFGIVPRTFALTDGRLVLDPWAVTLSAEAFLFTVIIVVVMQLIGNTIILDGQRRAQDRAQELLHGQAWQLGQLVPSSGSTP